MLDTQVKRGKYRGWWEHPEAGVPSGEHRLQLRGQGGQQIQR